MQQRMGEREEERKGDEVTLSRTESSFSPSTLPPARLLTDSPWFWLLLFSTFALFAMVATGRKYALRQGGIETKFQNRQTALAWEGQQIDSPEAIKQTRLPRSPNDRVLAISLRPLFLGISVLVALGLMGLSFYQLRQRNQESTQDI